MSFAKVYSAQTTLLKAKIIDIEIDLGKGLHSFSVVGLPDKAVEESKDRVGAAIKNSGFKSPKNINQKIVVALAPADLKKEGPNFDLGIALAYLLASKEINFKPENKLFLGELSLDGELRAIIGVLPLVREAKARGFTEIFLPKENAEEAALIDNINIYGAKNLKEIIDHLDEDKKTKEVEKNFKIPKQTKTEIKERTYEYDVDISHIQGQETAKRGLEIAAAGGHNMAMYGPPGTGKTMLAKAFAHLLPDLSFEEILDITGIHSVAGALREPFITRPPFRSPHHTSSYVSLVGGGVTPKPGEITLASKGVLFLDEFPEFERRVIDSLRQPLEDKVINISRAKGSAYFPADFILIAAMNPCPCGNFGTTGRECICSPLALSKYQRKISGPIVDRIDIWIEVSRIDLRKLSENTTGGESTKIIKERVLKAREIQNKRFKKNGLKIKTNSELGAKELNRIIDLSDQAKEILNRSAEKLDFSPRVYHRIMKLARTIADLSGAEIVLPNHILEAVQYRPKKL